VLFWDRYPYLCKYAVKYLCSVCILAYCTLGKTNPDFWDSNMTLWILLASLDFLLTFVTSNLNSFLRILH